SQNLSPVRRSRATTSPSAAAANRRSPSLAGVSRLYRSPWPSPTERLQRASRRTSSWMSGSSFGGSSFLLLLLQPTASTARASIAAFFQRITSGIPFRQVVELHLQATHGGVLGQGLLGLLVGRVGV